VSRKARNRAAAAAVTALVAGIVLAGGQVTGAFALFTGETQNQASTFSGGWIPAPSSLSDSVTGGSNSTISLTWTSGNSTVMPNGNTNPVTAQQLKLADGGSGGSASCGTYNNEGSQLGAAATSTTDNLGSVPAANWLCYQMVSESGTSGAGPWTSSATFGSIRLLAPISVAFAEHGGHAGSIENADTITITYNQSITQSPSSIRVCAFAAGSILIGDTSGGCNGVGDATSVGKITSLAIGANLNFKTTSTSVLGAVLTITLGGENSGTTGRTTVSGTGTFTPAGTGVASSPGGLNVCTSSSSPTCTVSTSGAF
jgi:hypothetical protein